ncbi:MAG: hypothetical protein AAF408_03640 [Pseudomonadota bacterium]
MSFPRPAFAFLLILATAVSAAAQTPDTVQKRLSLELNAVQDVNGACRLSFLAQNKTDVTIDQAVFETVIFDTSGGVVSLSLFDFRDLPAQRPRVRQFDVPDLSCAMIGKTLINGASSCLVEGAENPVCIEELLLKSRIEVELLG